MDPLPFSLSVPGKDTVGFAGIFSTQFHFRGLLRLDGDTLWIEWSGTAEVHEIGFSGIRSERLPLEPESLALPLQRIRAIESWGGWWRPRVEIWANDLEALQIVPGEDGGRLRVRIARFHRPLASQLIAAVRAGQSAPSLPPSATDPFPVGTPPDGAV